MSTRIMASCWPLEIPSTQKFVLIALADNSNDAGHCWPSIDTICERTSFGRTAVIDAIRWLESRGFLAANRSNGRKTTYTIKVADRYGMRTGDQPLTSTDDGPVGDDEPVRQADRCASRTGPAGGQNQSASRTGPVRQADTNRHITVKNRQKKKTRVAERPDSVPESVWDDFMAIREAKRTPLTETGLAGIRREAAKAGMTVAEALAMCCERGWQGFNAGWAAQQPRASPATPPTRQDRISATVAELTGRNHHPEIVDVIATERTTGR